MKKLILLVGLFTAVISTTNAQNKKAIKDAPQKEVNTTEASATKMTNDLDKIVNLTPSQRASIQQTNMSMAKRFEILNSSNSSSKESTMKELERNRTEMYMRELNPEQQAKYRAYLSQVKQ